MFWRDLKDKVLIAKTQRSQSISPILLFAERAKSKTIALQNGRVAYASKGHPFFRILLSRILEKQCIPLRALRLSGE